MLQKEIAMATKTMMYKDEDGKEYKISFSEELQMKNLMASKANTKWLKTNFLMNFILVLLLGILTLSIVYLFYRLDTVDFFTRILGNR